ncbi:hypothetical protein [Streptomyces sp. FXY-T5]|uniref:hypothetical protein n=1 Tax=Streptomyces sp. FXY-T5 TaxID=3064901 RepID=UPI0027D1F4F6|nr:hypothetical protein [Streptomyces sp. FXY-T5]WMD08106.1 hypothetical protein Q7C01_28690 [Streptomyces sp. FXY-T5]
MSGTGPVEPANSTDYGSSWDAIGTDAPCPAGLLADRRRGPRARRIPPNSPAKAGRFRCAVTVHRDPSATLQVAGTSHPGLTAHAIPGPAVTVPAGTPRAITVEITVSDRPALPGSRPLPFLDVTLRNARAIHRHSLIFGRGNARDLSDLFRAARGPSTA